MEREEFILTPATGKQFVGRKQLIKEFTEELSNQKSKTGFCIYGRRRTGKTSIMMEAKGILKGKKDIVIAYLSLYDIADLSTRTFAEELINAVLSAYQEKGLLSISIKIRKLLEAPLEIVTELLKNTRIEATVLEQIKILLEHRQNAGNSSEYVRHAFNTGEALAKATSTKCIIMLDEFPEILGIENGIQLVKMLRTQCENQKRTAIIISGSTRKTLEIVALSDSSPFYKQLVPMHVLPFTEGETGEFLNQYLGKTGKEEAKKLHDLTGGLPFYLQFMGRSTRYAKSTEETISKFIEQEGDLFFKEEFEKLSDKEKLIVISLSRGGRTLTEIAGESGEPATTIGRYLPTLIEEEIVEKESRGAYLLSDNLFSYWVKQKYASD